MDDFLIRVRSRIVSGCGGTSTLAKGTSLPAHRLHETATNEWGWGFHNVRGGFDPDDHRFRPRDVGGLRMLKDFSSGDEIISSPGATGPQSWQEGQLSLRAVSMSPGQSATRRWRGGFHAVPGGIDLRDHRFGCLLYTSPSPRDS